MEQMSVKWLNEQPKNDYILIDIRDEGSVRYGCIPGAINIPVEAFEGDESTFLAQLDVKKKWIFYCQRGQKSVEIAQKMEAYGGTCYSLEGGYNGYLMSCMMEDEAKDTQKQEKAELSIRKKFHKQLFSPFAKACKTYQLIQEGDHIAVCISGGKDSMLMAKLFQEIQRHRQVNFQLTFLVMDPGYNKENRALIESNAKILGIPITVFESEIFDAVDQIDKNPCYLCARMRRGYLYSKAKELGCNKIALGHHYDDVIETILMGMLYSGQIQTMMPKLHSTNFKGMELIRPMYLIREDDICRWRDYNELHFLQCACHFTETCSTCHDDGTTASKRLETKKIIATLKQTNPYVESHIFKSVENVQLNTVIGYKKDGVRHHFLDDYYEERFEFRNVRPEETNQAISIENICFPPNEACSAKDMKERVAKAPELFLVAVDKGTGKIAGFLNGLATNENVFRDEFFTDVNLYDRDGENIMLLGLDVLPEYRGRGLGRKLVLEYVRREQQKHRKMLLLTCLEAKVEMYKKFGFKDQGIANSTWGGEEWHEMTWTI